jgi:3-methyladenine DNA glycosylase AlkC
MPELFKDQFFNPQTIRALADHLLRCAPDFDRSAFVRSAGHGLEHLELMQRSAQITKALHQFLPADYEKAAAILLASLHPEEQRDISNLETDANGLAGFIVLPLSVFVAEAGQDHFELSMSLLKAMTKCFSSEFAIRFFLLKDLKRTLKVLQQWASDDNYHVRRLVSEGSRPRLPWAMRLPALMQDPSPLFPLLEKLKSDPELYVRRSVANNLNDIAKDHPDLVIQTAQSWQGKSRETDWVIKHACRTLLKKGRPDALELFGFGPVALKNNTQLSLDKSRLRIGDKLTFDFKADVIKGEKQKLRLEYVVDFVKANGKTSAKVFQISEKERVGDTINITRTHKFADLTTRKHYAGVHGLTVMVNGKKAAFVEFELLK